MDFWVRNSNLLKKYYPEFYQRVILRDFYCPDMNITDEANGNLRISKASCNCFLHSSYNIEREMEQMFKGISDDPNQTIIIFGLGLGYCLDYIRQHRVKYQTVIVLEPYNNIFRKLLEKRDISELLKMKSVSLNLFTNPLEIIPQLMGQVMLSRNINILFHLSYRSLFEDIFQEMSRLFINEKRVLMTSTATIDHFIRDWTQNQIKSIGRNDDSSSIFHNRFAGVPAIIVSAGPSLEKRVEELREIKEKALIIAPGTGAKICKNRDIKAHLGMAMDSDKEEADLFEDSNIKILIGSYRLNPKVYEVFPNRILRMLLNTENIARYYHEHNEIPQELISDFASVSSTAIYFAVKLGCNPIILVGQDMCYYGHRTHADEEENSIDDAVSARLVEAKDINGETVYTDTPFLALQRDMELLNQAIKSTNKLINASEAGLGIPGVENMRLRDVLDRYILPYDNDVTAIIESALMELDAADNVKRPSAELFLNHMLEELNRLLDINQEKKQELDKLKAMIDKGLKSNRLYDQLKTIRQKNDNLQDSQLYKIVVIPMLERFMSFFQAGVMYAFSKKNEDPRAWLYYEGNYYDLTNRYINMIKTLVLNEINGDAESGSLTFSNNALTINFK
ncbi:motility associated factor glycosyltransferase family protein [Syntrophomonas palmitatica]|uniref:motility associated factor glycosyltransferase family protein n=1 Tax=Syntrophomonas palmitatica TaxID=402877 RepID=UPI0006D124FE|nr:6-hydroxymethylpterin diphosphokinase MptE-like protein [Syntrophomonas palmitatica]